jgi:endonuclease/exonuclease/phosphatase family metal-dependent hydrolase
VTAARTGRARRRVWPAAGLVGLLLGLAAFVAGPVSAAGPVLRLATWNIEHLAAADGAGCRPRTQADYRELRAVAEELDADIIAVQEVQNAAALARVFDPAVYAHVVSARPEHGRDDCRGMPGQRRLAQRTGFAIHRARLARQGLDYRVLPAFRELGEGGRRWGVRIQIEDRDGPLLELMSIHLKSGCAYNRLDRDVRRHQCEILIRQRGVLEEWIDARAEADTPFVVLGDFNRQLDQRNDHFWIDIDDGEVCDWRPDPTLGRRCKPGSTRRDPDADLVLAGAGRPFPYPYNPRYPYAIDHIVLGGPAADWLVRGSWEVLDYRAEPKPSDHHPIAVTVQLP